MVFFQLVSELVLQSVRRVELAVESLLELRQGQAARPDEQHGIFCGLDHCNQVRLLIAEHFEHRGGNFARLEERDGRIGLRIKIDQKRLFPALGDGGGKIDGCRRLPDTALLICDRDDGSHALLPPPACRPVSTQLGPRSAEPGNEPPIYRGPPPKAPRTTLTLRKQPIAAQAKNRGGELSAHHALVSATCADALRRQQAQS